MKHMERMSRLKEIEQRLKEVKLRIGEDEEQKPEEEPKAEEEQREDVEAVEAEAEDLTVEELQELETEVQALIAEKEQLEGEETAEQEARSAVAAGLGIVKRNGKKEVERTMEDSKKMYRSAWLNKIRGINLTEEETRAYSNTTNAGAEVIPEELQNEIITKIKTLVPMLGEITVLHVKGAVRYAVEGTNNAASIHSENATISDSEDTLAEVTLGSYEIAKLVTISDTVRTMSIDSFEGWLTDRLAEAIARKLEDLIINGTGSSQPTGINKAYASWTDNTNQITVAAASSLTAANVQSLISLLNAGYDKNAKFLMNKKTLWQDFMPLQDKNKNDLVQGEAGKYNIYGYPVLVSDYVADHIAFLGDYTKVVANLAEDINVHNDYDITKNNYRFAGIAIFDCKPALGEAFVKLNKASE